MTPTKHKRRTGTFPIPSQYFGDKAAAHQRIADSPGYQNNREAKAAELLEVAHYSSLAAEALNKETRKHNG